MKMSEEMAVRLHRMMWSDMQRELGDNPDASDRNRFKEKWCETHFPGEHIHFNCFLCDYCGHDYNNNGCDKCPIEWPDGVCSRAFGLQPVKVDYRFAPISEILALPTRNKELVTMDVDDAFKQYADEQKAPIFRALAEASGLSAGNESVKAHISEISNRAKQNGRLERSDELFKALSVYSGVSKDDWRFQDHVEAIQIKERENLQPLREANGHMSSLITKYKDRLSDTSGLDRNRPVDDHVRAIFNNGFEAGKESARDLLLNKIEEILGQ